MSVEERIIRDLLRELTISSSYKGYNYLVYGLIVLLEDEMLLTCLAKGLYNEISKRYDAKLDNIERNIRTLKYVVWDRNKKNPIFKYHKCCPSNGDFWDLLLYEVQKRVAAYNKINKELANE